MLRKAISIGVTAALLGTLMVALVPSVALGATPTVTPTASIVRGSGTAVGTGSIAITEDAVNEWAPGGFKMRIWIRDSAGAATVHFDTTAGVAVGPDSLSPTAKFVAGDNTAIDVTVGTSNASQKETLVISGLKIWADGLDNPPIAALGAIKVFYLLDTSGWNAGGTSTGASTGVFKVGYGAGVVGPVTVVLDSGSPAFTVTNLPTEGQLSIAAPNAEKVDITAVAGVVAGEQILTTIGALAYPHSPGVAVSQPHGLANCLYGGVWPPAVGFSPACMLPSLGTVVDALYLSSTWEYIQRGLINSQWAGDVTLAEQGDVLIPANAVVTLKLDPAIKVLFSTPAESNGGWPCDLSADRLTMTCNVHNVAGLGKDSLRVYDIQLDASTASPAAADVDVTVTVAGVGVTPASTTIAKLMNFADATADSPQVIIGENNQQSGTVAIREAKAGALGSSATNNLIIVCYASHETFTRAPWLVVTTGDLKLRTPSDPTLPATAAAPGTGVKGMLVERHTDADTTYCAYWIVWSKSTVASILEIRGSDSAGAMLGAGPAHGPQINVPHFLRAGPSMLSLWLLPGIYHPGLPDGLSWPEGTEIWVVTNAVRVYGGTPLVTAVSSPEIWRGMPSQAAGNVTVTETGNHQFGETEQILFSVVLNNLRDIIPSVRFDTNRDTPVVSTNAASTGLVAHFQGYLNPIQFAVMIDQRAFVPVVGAWVPGVITVSAMKYTTTNDAAYGNVQLEVCTPAFVANTQQIDIEFGSFFGGIGIGLCFYRGLYGHDMMGDGGIINPTQFLQVHPGAWADFDQVVANAHVVSSGIFPSIQIAPGFKFRETGPYITFGTLQVKAGTWVTNKVYIGAQFQGKRIEFWQRNGKTGTWVKRTTGRVDGKGYSYWSTQPPKLSGTGFARYVYYRAYFAGTTEIAAAWSQTTTRVVVH